jgi:hypothetical protein
MGINIARVAKHLNIMKDYGYVDDVYVDEILMQLHMNKSKCFKYVEKYENTFFNSKQWSQLKKEIDILRSNPNIPDEVITAFYRCLEDVKIFPDHYFGFIGD